MNFITRLKQWPLWRVRTPSSYTLPPPVRRDLRDIEKACARLFATTDGELVLAHLTGQTLHRALGLEATDAALRYSEGQRALLLSLARLIERGRAG